MPNYTDKPRQALLLNYIQADIIEELKNNDELFLENGEKY